MDHSSHDVSWTHILTIPYAGESLAYINAAGLRPAYVVADLGAALSVVAEAGQMNAPVSGSLAYRIDLGVADRPSVGMFVGLDTEGDRIELLAPVRNRYQRGKAGRETAPQTIAANIDEAWFITAAGGDFNPRRVRRYLANIDGESTICPVVIVNKIDTAEDPETLLSEMRSAIPGVAVVGVSALTGEGVPELERRLSPGTVVCLVGSSGVGKSTLLNRLLGGEVAKTQEVRADDDRGRHTTTSRRIYAVAGGALVVDLPGMREVQMWSDDVTDAFEDVDELAHGCRFRDCTHNGEPGCAVAEAVADGTLSQERAEAYRTLRAEVGMTKEMRAERQRILGKRIARLSRDVQKRRNALRSG